MSDTLCQAAEEADNEIQTNALVRGHAAIVWVVVRDFGSVFLKARMQRS
jgi:hypothetical protein